MPETLSVNACPNCGSRELEINVDDDGARLRCCACWLRGPDVKTVVGAVNVWNRIRMQEER